MELSFFNMGQIELWLLNNIVWKKILKVSFDIDLYHKYIRAMDWSKHRDYSEQERDAVIKVAL